MRPALIYGLVDPRSDTVRYIGWCYNLTSRLKDHICRAAANKEDTWKARWIRKLLTLGLRPIAVVLEETTAEDRGNRERWWIADMRAKGCPLTNTANGGPGCPGYKHSPETIAKFAAKLRGRPKSMDHREKLRISHLGMKASIEARLKMSQSHRGQKMPQSAIERTAAAHRGMKRSEDTRARLRTAWQRRASPQRDLAGRFA